MGRPTEGFKLRRRPGRKFWSVMFTHEGKPYELGTGESDQDLAARAGARIYGAVVSGRHQQRRRASPALGNGSDLGETASRWLTRADGTTLDARTAQTYALYVSVHLYPFFPTLESVTEQRAAEYVADRLRQVRGGTVRKELSCLRGLLGWAVEQGMLPEAPKLPSVPKRLPGTPHRQGRRPKVNLTPSDVRRLLAELPELSRDGQPIRARYVVAYETALRPETLDRLEWPRHYRKGAAFLIVDDADDKARHRREVPLTPEARHALDACLPKQPGPIFGPRRFRDAFDAASLRALGTSCSPYALRRARITHWLERSANLPGTQYLAGHRRAETTAIYVQPTLRAGLEVLRVSRTRGR